MINSTSSDWNSTRQSRVLFQLLYECYWSLIAHVIWKALSRACAMAATHAYVFCLFIVVVVFCCFFAGCHVLMCTVRRYWRKWNAVIVIGLGIASLPLVFLKIPRQGPQWLVLLRTHWGALGLLVLLRTRLQATLAIVR